MFDNVVNHLLFHLHRCMHGRLHTFWNLSIPKLIVGDSTTKLSNRFGLLDTPQHNYQTDLDCWILHNIIIKQL